jgi:TnpA family transposase
MFSKKTNQQLTCEELIKYYLSLRGKITKLFPLKTLLPRTIGSRLKDLPRKQFLSLSATTFMSLILNSIQKGISEKSHQRRF